MIILQEADELAYRCAFACQKQAYKLTTSKGITHDFKDKYTKTDIIKHFKSRGKELDVDYTLEGYLVIEPEYIVKHTLDKMIEKLWFIKHESMSDDVSEVQLWLSPRDHSNFRYQIVEIMGPHGIGYKAGRVAKPHYLEYTRRLLVERYGAQEIKGFEADDALGIYANKNTILSHIDKDINMIGGCWHYNHVSCEMYFVPEGLGTLEFDNEKNKIIGRGLAFFYIQMLTGDSIDNIPGCKNPEKSHHAKPPNFSAKEAYRLLCNAASEDAAWDCVKAQFQYTYKDRWLDAVQEIADLLYIVRADRLTGRQYLKKKGYI